MRTLPIRWQRLVDSEGQTCVRCAATQDKVEHAVATLTKVLAPLDISPQLEMAEVDNAAFQASPVESNRIWIGGRPMEDWLQATVGSSRCWLSVWRRPVPHCRGPRHDVRSDS